ncbi:hypothetical protein EJ05DRAFT_541563 [Pseudovirgaria hyperparasitica]|uniref:Rhodanese domain-containing protein n=1 Tax=Pseudovirgaria hyperparasitica TaxID=470096 RepID=A0A6A6VW38_9PEZI|nr:uncharacterized protein EJ05DRAFT_541563 [Pseudovirgaria hyperparasitica]KAF2754006.1 hypothetical protein EJ05DRAFT_541563 [Pseudovirgaria hyperparasitica]
MSSDPISYTCTCPASTNGGSILLFYRYFANDPVLPQSPPSQHNSPQDSVNPQLSQDPESLATFHRTLASRLNIAGKFRLSHEGFNITLGGPTSSITQYIAACTTHWSFAGLDLSTDEQVARFFKPTPGCACAFGQVLSVRVTSEITPLGITNYSPADWSCVTPLRPREFHEMCRRGDVRVVDVRNHYESRIGYFVTGKGESAVRPGVRRFSQWPGYVARHVLGDEGWSGREGVLTYCTGGVRCEKGARWMAEVMQRERDVPVYTLDGGIVAYQAWVKGEVEAGRMRGEESLFKGRNYVFDGRGAIGEGEGKAVAVCQGCGVGDDRLGKCIGVGCHLVLVVCEECDGNGGVFCCDDCREVDAETEKGKGRRICACEREREKSLWGDGGARLGALQRRKKTKTHVNR